jgi:hypothetical protein
MTLAEIKDTATTVPVYNREDRHTYTGHITGRLQRFPTVTFRVQNMDVAATYSWAAIQRALGTNTPLIY